MIDVEVSVELLNKYRRSYEWIENIEQKVIAKAHYYVFFSYYTVVSSNFKIHIKMGFFWDEENIVYIITNLQETTSSHYKLYIIQCSVHYTV